MIGPVPVRAGTTAEWADADASDNAAAPVLGLGELGVDTDLQAIKVGDGETAFADLDAILSVPVPPTITSISPDSGVSESPIAFTITGTNLDGIAEVNFHNPATGGNAGGNVTVVDSEHLTRTQTFHISGAMVAGTYDVQLRAVHNGPTLAELTAGFTLDS